jgi:hypothetical protein
MANINQNNHSQPCRHRQKWPPSAPHEALRSALTHQMDGQQPPKQVDIIFGTVKGVYGTLNTPMLWRFIIAGTKEHFEGNKPPQPPQKIHLQAREVVIHLFKASAWSTRPHVGR